MLVVDLYDAGFWVFMRTGEEGLKGGGDFGRVFIQLKSNWVVNGIITLSASKVAFFNLIVSYPDSTFRDRINDAQ